MIPKWMKEFISETEAAVASRQEVTDAREQIRQSVTPDVLKLLDTHGWPKLKHGTKRRRLVSSAEKRDRARLEMLKSGELR
jgi:hypothetical protein